ncbi:MAG: hypothetical protein LiPW41_269 [Parcubacteria group bacterium LiPW_41]|nr:MAG: hypothetical protein LiPW41_269 [Parcubacteria group bacterium LiPW_41]
MNGKHTPSSWADALEKASQILPHYSLIVFKKYNVGSGFFELEKGKKMTPEGMVRVFPQFAEFFPEQSVLKRKEIDNENN